jgi:hypothetical protein
MIRSQGIETSISKRIEHYYERNGHLPKVWVVSPKLMRVLFNIMGQTSAIMTRHGFVKIEVDPSLSNLEHGPKSLMYTVIRTFNRLKGVFA